MQRYRGLRRVWTSSFNFRVLICCCLAVGARNPVIWEILRLCYNCGALTQPDVLDSKGYLNQISAVLECLLALNFVAPLGATESKLETRAWQSFKDINPNIYERDIREVLGLDIGSFFDIIKLSVDDDVKRQDLESVLESTFRFGDFNLGSLHDIGKLSVRWTAFH